MSQSKYKSFLESVINTAIGYIVAIASQLVIFPMVGVDVDLHTNLVIGAWFTAISIVRGYFVRRLFNRF